MRKKVKEYIVWGLLIVAATIVVIAAVRLLS